MIVLHDYYVIILCKIMNYIYDPLEEIRSVKVYFIKN